MSYFDLGACCSSCAKTGGSCSSLSDSGGGSSVSVSPHSAAAWAKKQAEGAAKTKAEVAAKAGAMPTPKVVSNGRLTVYLTLGAAAILGVVLVARRRAK